MIRSPRKCDLVASVLFAFCAIGASGANSQPLDSGITRRHVETRTYLSYATESLDTLIAYGTDRYGAVQSDLLVSNLDVTTKNNPVASALAAADEAWRVERRQRRAPGGVNFLHNQSVYSSMIAASQATGNQAYAQFVDSNFDWALDKLVDENNMFWWGYHRHYDVHTDTFAAEAGEPHHEMHFIDVPLWDRMWNRNSVAVRGEIEAIWDRHVVDKSTGQINRHDDPGGLSFITSSASFIDAFAFLSSKSSGDDRVLWRNRALLLANYNWNDRNPETNLLAHTPNESSRWDGLRSVSTTPAVYVPALLRAYAYTGDTTFRTQALAFLKSWAEHAYDPASGSFWASLELDGTPVPGPWAPGGYEQFEPRGLIDFWAPEFITAQFHQDAAKAYALGYQQFGDPQLLDVAQKWSSLVRENLPARQSLEDTWYETYSRDWAPHGTYAEHYGHLIEFYVALYETTGQNDYLFSARDLAKDAISSLWYDGLFRGHPNKPYYEAVDGVGILLESLIGLDQYQAQFTKFGDFNGDNLVDMLDYNALVGHWLSPVAPYSDGDVTGDGFVDLRDFNRFKAEYFEAGVLTATAPPVVPEPHSAVMLLILLTIVSSRHRGAIRAASTSRSAFS